MAAGKKNSEGTSEQNDAEEENHTFKTGKRPDKMPQRGMLSRVSGSAGTRAARSLPQPPNRRRVALLRGTALEEQLSQTVEAHSHAATANVKPTSVCRTVSDRNMLHG